jgi:DNA-binding transcriptional LysR family regulator
LRVSAATGFGLTHVIAFVPEFLAAHPHVTLDLQLSNRYVDLIEEGYDLAVRVGSLTDSRLVARRIAPSRRILVASPDYLARYGSPRRTAALADHACLVLEVGSHPQRWELLQRATRMSVEVAGPLRSNNVIALLAACRSGLGIALLPEFAVAAALRHGELMRVLPAWAAVEQGIYAVYPSGRFVPGKVRAFVDFFAEKLRVPLQSPAKFVDIEALHSS